MKKWNICRIEGLRSHMENKILCEFLSFNLTNAYKISKIIESGKFFLLYILQLIWVP